MGCVEADEGFAGVEILACVSFGLLYVRLRLLRGRRSLGTAGVWEIWPWRKEPSLDIVVCAASK